MLNNQVRFSSRLISGLLATLLPATTMVSAQGSFTYQGQLQDGDGPADGTYDLFFELFSDAGGSNSLGTDCADDVGVEDGLFSVLLDFGANAFDGGDRFLELSVRTDTGDACDQNTGTYTVLMPLQEITSAPQSLFAFEAAAVTGGIDDADPDPKNELNTSFELGGSTLRLVDAGGALNVDLSGLAGTEFGDGHSLDGSDGDPVDAVFVNPEGLTGIGTLVPEGGLHIASGAGTGNILLRDRQGSVGPEAIAVQGDFVYIPDFGNQEFTIFDVSDPDNIVLRDQTDVGLSFPVDVSVDGSLAYVLDQGTFVLAIFDVSDPDNIEALDTEGAGITTPTDLAVEGNFAYILNDEEMVEHILIYDVSQPKNIVPMDTESTSFSILGDIAVQGDYVYVVAEDPATLAIYDVSNPSNIVPMDTDTTGLLRPLALAVEGDFAYVVDENVPALAIFDISNPSAIVARDTETMNLDRPFDIAIQGDFAYVVDFDTDLFLIFDISDPDNIVPLGTFGTGFTNPGSVAVQGNFAYVGDSTTDELTILEVGGSFNAPSLIADGLVGIGTKEPEFTLHVNGTAGKPGGGSWSVPSDSRLKEIRADFTRGLDALEDLQPIRYRYRDGNPLGLPGDAEHVGLSAQNVEATVPEAVSGNREGYLHVNNDPIIWTMLNGIRELKSENDMLQKENDELRQRLEKLEGVVLNSEEESR